MSVVGHAPPPFFRRGPAPLVRLVFFVLLSLILLIADLRFRTLEWARLAVAAAAWPLQRATGVPIDVAGDMGAYLARQSELLKENENYRRRQLETANLLLRQRHLEQENLRLRALLDMRARQPVEGRIAEILYATRDPFSRRIIIDKGIQHGIKAGQAVVDDLGVIGQVVRVFPLTAEVLLLTDKDQVIPVEVQRNGLRAILAGAGADAMELRFQTANTEVRVGDILVTSGLDGVYLPGLPVAKVVKVDRESSDAFARISCVPLAGVERHGLALVLGSRTEIPPQPDAIEQRDSSPAQGVRKKKKAD